MFLELYLWYFLIGIIFCIFEVLFLTFYLLPIGIAAIFTGIIALFVFSYHWHLFSFIIFSVLLFYFILKWKKSRFLKPIEYPVILGLIGQTGLVVEEFSSTRNPGKIKIYSDVWDLYYDKKDEPILANLKIGEVVKVTQVYGNKVCVKKI